MTLQDEIALIPELEKATTQLVQLAQSLFPNSAVEKKGRRWVLEPNFVTFQIQHARARNVAVTLRGNPDEFSQRPDLNLKADQAGYSIFRLETADQLNSASDYILRAAELYKQGRRR